MATEQPMMVPDDRPDRRRKRQGGTAALEFALTAPFLLLFLMAVVELGFAMHETMQVYNSVEAGALYASKNGFDSAGISAAVVNATGTSGLTASPAPAQFCGCPQTTGVTTVSCGSTCTGGTAPGQYIRVYAALPHTSILPVFALPLPATLTAQAIVRLN
jgi:Flp pilus assembly protein TadG